MFIVCVYWMVAWVSSCPCRYFYKSTFDVCALECVCVCTLRCARATIHRYCIPLVVQCEFLNHPMNMKVCCVLILSLLAVVCALDINQCNTVSKPIPASDITIASCKKWPCKLKRGTSVELNIKLSPDAEITSLLNTVYATILGLPLPFVGTDNTDACPFIFNENGEKVGCPLKSGNKYIYKNTIKVLPIYPAVSLTVHWGLTMKNGKDLSCFEIPAKIVN